MSDHEVDEGAGDLSPRQTENEEEQMEVEPPPPTIEDTIGIDAEDLAPPVEEEPESDKENEAHGPEDGELRSRSPSPAKSAAQVEKRNDGDSDSADSDDDRSDSSSNEGDAGEHANEDGLQAGGVAFGRLDLNEEQLRYVAAAAGASDEVLISVVQRIHPFIQKKRSLFEKHFNREVNRVEKLSRKLERQKQKNIEKEEEIAVATRALEVTNQRLTHVRNQVEHKLQKELQDGGFLVASTLCTLMSPTEAQRVICVPLNRGGIGFDAWSSNLFLEVGLRNGDGRELRLMFGESEDLYRFWTGYCNDRRRSILDESGEGNQNGESTVGRPPSLEGLRERSANLPRSPPADVGASGLNRGVSGGRDLVPGFPASRPSGTADSVFDPNQPGPSGWVPPHRRVAGAERPELVMVPLPGRKPAHHSTSSTRAVPRNDQRTSKQEHAKPAAARSPEEAARAFIGRPEFGEEHRALLDLTSRLSAAAASVMERIPSSSTGTFKTPRCNRDAGGVQNEGGNVTSSVRRAPADPPGLEGMGRDASARIQLPELERSFVASTEVSPILDRVCSRDFEEFAPVPLHYSREEIAEDLISRQHLPSPADRMTAGALKGKARPGFGSQGVALARSEEETGDAALVTRRGEVVGLRSSVGGGAKRGSGAHTPPDGEGVKRVKDARSGWVHNDFRRAENIIVDLNINCPTDPITPNNFAAIKESVRVRTEKVKRYIGLCGPVPEFMISLPGPGELKLCGRSTQTTGFPLDRGDREKIAILLITDSTFCKVRAGAAHNSRFGKMHGSSVGMPESGRLDAELLFANLFVVIYQVSISGLSAIFGHAYAGGSLRRLVYQLLGLPPNFQFQIIVFRIGTNDLRFSLVLNSKAGQGVLDYPADTDELFVRVGKYIEEQGVHFNCLAVHIGFGNPHSDNSFTATDIRGENNISLVGLGQLAGKVQNRVMDCAQFRLHRLGVDKGRTWATSTLTPGPGFEVLFMEYPEPTESQVGNGHTSEKMSWVTALSGFNAMALLLHRLKCLPQPSVVVDFAAPGYPEAWGRNMEVEPLQLPDLIPLEVNAVYERVADLPGGFQMGKVGVIRPCQLSFKAPFFAPGAPIRWGHPTKDFDLFGSKAGYFIRREAHDGPEDRDHDAVFLVYGTNGSGPHFVKRRPFSAIRGCR